MARFLYNGSSRVLLRGAYGLALVIPVLVVSPDSYSSQQGITRKNNFHLHIISDSIKSRNNYDHEIAIQRLRDLGAIIFNPHVITVEDGGLGIVDGDQVKLKINFDPKAFLHRLLFRI